MAQENSWSAPRIHSELLELGFEVDERTVSRSARYRRQYQTLFARGKDTATGQNVGAILDTSRGWGVHGQASRV
jgi:hypothetical protein